MQIIEGNENIVALAKDGIDNLAIKKLQTDRSELMKLSKKRLYKNANLVDIDKDCCVLVDILIDEGNIQKIGSCGEFDDLEVSHVEDLKENFVLPTYYNAFSEIKKVFETNFDIIVNDKLKPYVEEFMQMKNILAGVDYNRASFDNKKIRVLENITEYSEKQLSDMSDEIAKGDFLFYIKAGQDLEELGTVDKMYGKSLVQVLEDFGFLDRKPIIVGGNCFEKDDLQLLKQYDCSFVVCPCEDARFGHRPTNITSLQNLDFDIRIGSGYSYEVDFFGFMRQLLMTQRAMFEDVDALTEQEVLKISVDQKKLQEGSLANFCVIRKEESLYDSVCKQLVWGKNKKDILMTVHAGKIFQRNGGIVSGEFGLDYQEILKKIKEMIKEIK